MCKNLSLHAMSSLFRLASILLVMVLISSCGFNGLFYYPEKESFDPPAHAEEIKIQYHKKHGSFTSNFYKNDSAKTSIFFLHGNAGTLKSWSGVADIFYEAGYNFFIMDYPEFGESEGKAKHKYVKLAAQLAFDYFIELPEVKNTKVLLMGFSLGGNLAQQVGHDNQDQIDAMLLEGPFIDHNTVAASRTPRPMRFSAYLLVRNAVRGKRLMKTWNKPLLVVHSKEDVVCEYKMGKEIYERSPSHHKELWTIDGKHLAGLTLYRDQYLQKVQQLME